MAATRKNLGAGGLSKKDAKAEANGSLAIGGLLQRLPALASGRVLIVGDVMLDEYFLGDASRISPEAPVPVVLVSGQRQLLGGAANVARNIKDLGGKPTLLGACGDGHNSAKLRQLLAEEKIEHALIPLPGRPATTKTRILARGQQVLRIDHEDGAQLSREQSDELLRNIARLWPEQKVLILSDYCKGVISEYLLDGIAEIKAKHPNPVRILVDPKTPNFHLYKGVDLLTPNTKETGEGAGLPARDKEEIIAAGRAIFRKLGCKELLTTLGPDGMALFRGEGEIIHIPTLARQVYDVTGAGDTVISTVGLALSAGFDMLEACVIANYAAGIVVGKSGSATTSLEELAAAMRDNPALSIQAW